MWRDGDWKGFVRIAVACAKLLLLVLPHRVVQPYAPVAGLSLGVGDGIDDDVIVELFEDDVEGEDAQTRGFRRTLTSVCERPLRRQPA